MGLAVPGVRIAHELPHRLRLCAAHLFRNPGVDTAYLGTLVENLPGVRSVRVNAGARSLIIDHEGGPAIRAAILDRVARIDPGELPGIDRRAETGRLPQMLLAVAALVAVRLLPLPLRPVVTWLAIVPTLAAGAGVLVTRGIRVEVLDAVAVGTTAARGDVTTALATHLFLNLGEHLEASTNRSSEDLLRRLLKPTPSRVWVERAGEVVQVGTADVRAGEIVVVQAGDMVPVDGQVVSGTAQVNESAISGEFVPVAKEAGGRVVSGTVIEDGRLRVRAIQVGADTTSARLARFLQEALGQRSTIQRTAERLAQRRVGITLGLGVLTWLLTRDPSRLASVFLVDYSCALKLGTPVAIKATMYHGARRAILIKGGHAIERLAEVDTVVFDKTGTLTHARLDVTDVLTLAPATWPENRLLAAIASIEEHSSHPVADAVVSAARERRLGHVSHDDVEFIVAHGLVSEVQAGRVVIGSRHFLEEHEGIGFAAHEPAMDRLEAEGKSLLFMAVDGQLVGIVALRDRVRAEAAGILTALRRLGITNLVIITGDRRRKAMALGEALNVDEVFAEQPPERKADIVRALQARGRKVAFVGDGVNDAPALVAADVGIAMPHGADLARASADIVLLEDRLDILVEARVLTMRTMGLIRSNFRLAIGVNSVLFLAAALGLAPPIVTSFLHNGTTIGVLLRGLAAAGHVDRQPRRPRRRTPTTTIIGQPKQSLGEASLREAAD